MGGSLERIGYFSQPRSVSTLNDSQTTFMIAKRPLSGLLPSNSRPIASPLTAEKSGADRINPSFLPESLVSTNHAYFALSRPLRFSCPWRCILRSKAIQAFTPPSDTPLGMTASPTLPALTLRHRKTQVSKIISCFFLIYREVYHCKERP